MALMEESIGAECGLDLAVRDDGKHEACFLRNCSFFAIALRRLIIIIAAPIMIGLTMDYDMFLITKIYELRQKGYSTRFAILSGSSVVCY